MKMKQISRILGLVIWFAMVQTSLGFYNPSTGKWLSRDPVGETGGKELYGFVCNNAVSYFDRLGLETVTDEIWVKSNYQSKRITGPVGTRCCKLLTGTVKVDYAFIKADRGEKLGENHQAVVNYITAIVKTTTKAQGSIQMASYLGAGFGITFTPSAKGKICCKKIYWVQRFVRDGSYYVPWYMTGVGGIDYTSSGPSAVDFPGDTVSGLRDRDYSRTFELSLFCDTQEMYSFVWSYQVKYDSTKNSATVTLDFPF